MRVAAFFVLYFSFLLSRGNDAIYAATQYTQGQHVAIMQPENFSDSNADFAIVKGIDLDNGAQYLISDDIEEEDANNVSPRKYKLLTKPYITPPYTFSVSNFHNSFKDRRSFSAHLSYKYSTHSVLRI
jgi:hypothetical protein